jgi:hypothetical protein
MAEISRTVFLGSLLLLASSLSSSLIATGGHVPENIAADSDLVLYGAVDSISNSSSVEGYHTVNLEVIESLRGEAGGVVPVEIRGNEEMEVSTAPSFSRGEEVVVMLQEREDGYYMTRGYASKYEVENNTIELGAPERKNITVAKMESMVEESPAPNNTAGEVSEEREDKSGAGLIENLVSLLTFLTE